MIGTIDSVAGKFVGIGLVFEFIELSVFNRDGLEEERVDDILLAIDAENFKNCFVLMIGLPDLPFREGAIPGDPAFGSFAGQSLEGPDIFPILAVINADPIGANEGRVVIVEIKANRLIEFSIHSQDDCWGFNR